MRENPVVIFAFSHKMFPDFICIYNIYCVVLSNCNSVTVKVFIYAGGIGHVFWTQAECVGIKYLLKANFAFNTCTIRAGVFYAVLRLLRKKCKFPPRINNMQLLHSRNDTDFIYM